MCSGSRRSRSSVAGTQLRAGGTMLWILRRTELARQGLTVTSGLASGIDSIAHGCSAGCRLPHGCGHRAPGWISCIRRAAGNWLRSFAVKGVLVSEFPPGTPARRKNFPSRNRIISGLSLGVLVIEAGLNSGTLITARMAGNQGREVFALPGSIHNPMSKGCHRLIREGTRLVETGMPRSCRRTGAHGRPTGRRTGKTAGARGNDRDLLDRLVGRSPNWSRILITGCYGPAWASIPSRGGLDN